MLRAENVHAFYHHSHILHGTSVKVGDGEVVCLIGRNGVGKTTLLRSVMGLAHVREGKILLRDRDVTGLPAYEVARLGVGFVPEGRGIFASLTVFENLKLGLMNGRGAKRIPERVYEYFPVLKERARQVAGSLSGGEQQMLAIARALVGSPYLLLIDEFSEGLQPTIVQRIAEIVHAVNREGVSVLLVEQNARLALALSQRAYIMEKGRIVWEGRSVELLENEDVLHKHLVI